MKQAVRTAWVFGFLLLFLASCTPPAQPPSAPTGFTATNTASGISLSWNAVPGATGYTLQRKTASAAYADLPGAANLSGTTYTDTGLSPSTTYTYRIAAKNAAGSSPYVESAPVVTPAALQTPNPPNNFRSTAVSSSSVSLAWDPPSPNTATGYTLERKTGSGAYAQIATPTGSPYTDTGLSPSTAYTYRLKAVNAAGSSNGVTVDINTGVAAPGAPGGFSASVVTGTSTVVTLTWTPPSAGGPVQSYTLERSTDGGSSYLTLSTGLPASATTYADLSANALAAPRSALYRLTAVGAGGPGAPVTASAGGIPGLCNPAGPDIPTAATTGCFGAPFQWPLVATFGGLQPDGTFLAWYSTDPSGSGVFKNYLDYNQHKSSYAVVWNPAKGRTIDFDPNNGTPAGARPGSAFARVDNNRTDLFCAGQVIGPDGRFYVAGGNLGNFGDWYPGGWQTNIYDWRTQSWSAGPNMKGDPQYPYTPQAPGTSSVYPNAALYNLTSLDPNGQLTLNGGYNVGGRWYPSVITLSSGKLLINGGLGYFGNPYQNDGVTSWYTGVGNSGGDGLPKTKTPPYGDNVIPEVWDTTTNTLTQLTGARMDTLFSYDHYYPWMFQDPYNPNQAFMAGGETTAGYLNVTGTGYWTDVMSNALAYRHYGSAAMYQPGKILLVGGGGLPNDTPPKPSRKDATVLTLSPGNTVSVQPTANDMIAGRTHTDATLLPNGQVWVNGGNTDGANWSTANAVYTSEMWDPTTLAFTPMATATQPRIYHATATLMQDGTVLTVGGGGDGTTGCGATDAHGVPTAGLTCGINQFNAEIYYPPYLFKPDGSLAPRPTLLSLTSPSGTDGYGHPRVRAGDSLTLTTDRPAGNIARVTFLKLGSTTHAFNMGQNFNELTISSPSGNTLRVSAPGNYNVAPPGYYFLFVLDADGVPSVAQIVQMSR
ncbi:fibronectin type III domain-containing protein [Meiothermus granaticius]|uniref:Chitinase A1 n=1 Tax=Meiothermus granaticius NBRC 107808 TaxID=1227551 RepID=A0A399F7S0_9DEIN|nr:fibronectin type III domain-containing protein [Meiothermus granaticius]RIH92150.1 Chitinase A1 [Meiothermus granaticius NBRC 107808]GEM86553.1 hypothetical protein MGR01S_11780 [Meiothermus granaticius NBRC 107808]